MVRSQRKSLAMGWALLICAMLTSRVQGEEVKPAAEDLRWMQTALDRWEITCRRHLRLPVEPLAWIIFYDENYAWHISVEKELLSAHETTPIKLNFAGTARELLRVPHKAGLWVPEREGRLPIKIDLHAAPYADEKKTYCIIPLPSLIHKLEPATDPATMDEIFLGFAQHELTHTRQLLFVGEQLRRLSEIYRLPKQLDDNLLENTFGSNKAYTKRFHLEVDAFGDAALANTTAECNRYLARALRMVQQRHARYFVGQRKLYASLDEIFLTLEGTAMWAQFQMVREHAPAGEDISATFTRVMNDGKSWVQVEGMALFLLIDRLVPDWQTRYFAPNPPSPFALLQEALRKTAQKTSGK